MKTTAILILISLFMSGCGLLPYKSDYTCPNAIGGSCGNALQSYNSALNDVYNNKNKVNENEYVGENK